MIQLMNILLYNDTFKSLYTELFVLNEKNSYLKTLNIGTTKKENIHTAIKIIQNNELIKNSDLEKMILELVKIYIQIKI